MSTLLRYCMPRAAGAACCRQCQGVEIAPLRRSPDPCGEDQFRWCISHRLYWKLLHAAGKATGLPVLYNTSFNLFSEPLVCTPRDAARSFYSSGIDAMFVGNFFLQK